MEVQILKSGYKTLVSRDDELKLSIAKVMGRRVATIERWLREDDTRLTTVTVLTIIRKKLGLKMTDVLTEPSELEKQTA